MASHYIGWLISFCGIAIALLTVSAVDAASFRNWLYLMTAALVPPMVLLGCWRDHPERTADVMRRATFVTPDSWRSS